MKETFSKKDSCESQIGRIDSGGFIPFTNPTIRHVLHEVPAPGEVERCFPIPSLGDTLVPSDNNHDHLENRLRRARADMERRIHGGDDGCFAEEYFKACPELAANVDTAIDLIYTEFTACEEAGRPRPEEDYYGRFPQWRKELERQFLVHKEIGEPHPTRMICILGPEGRREQYHFLKEISQSPNGNIDKARHISLNRLVAIKTFAGGDQADVERFQLGAREQQRLHHDNILPVYHVSESEDGHPCFSMEFADGGSLAEKIAGKPQPPKEAAQLVRTLAEAMSYAHGEGVVHRDLKPANVVLTADDTPKITDFGLARRVDTPNGQSKTGDILGTPPYMAPEQAAGRTHEAGPVCDVYALGAILYELLTGRPPFKGRTVVESLQQILKQPPVRPRRLLRGVPPGLESICLKCLEKKPRRRYRSAQELADDLGRWLDGKRPEAHSTWARTSRFLRRHPISTPAAAFLLLAAIIAPMVVYRMDSERERERIERDLAAGKQVTLIREKGPPRWHEWATNNPTQRDSLGPDNSYRVECPEGWALKELVRDPQHSHYRYSARVRHEQLFDGIGHVGIYFAYSRHQSASGTECCFCSVGLNALTEKKRRYRNFEGNPVSMFVRYHADPGANRSSCNAGYPLFLPVSREPISTWLEIAVKVSPEKIRFTISRESQVGWESQSEEVGRETIEYAKNLVCGSSSQGSPIVDFDPDLSPRSSLGLYVSNGSALFQNVVVTPEPQQD